MNDYVGWKELLKKQGFKEKQSNDSFLDQVVSVFLHQHHEQLRPIQEVAIKPIYKGENVVLISSTASGKTEAVTIPIAARLAKDRNNSLCVYLAPTRALLNDLEKRLKVPFHRLGLQLGIRHGDRPLSSTDRELPFLLTTPESLDILLCKDYVILNKTQYVVCDEIHQIYGSPRGLQLIFLLQRLEKKAGKQIQRTALSATIGSQERLVKWFQNGSNPISVFSVPSDRKIDAEIMFLTRDNTLKKVIEKTRAKKILIFVNSRRKCDDLYLELQSLMPYQVFVHYSSLEKEQREYVENHFKRSKFAICVATTTLELGIDIGSIESIILYEPPQSVTSYLQRIGRGSRRGKKTWVIMTPKNTLELLQFCALTSLASEGTLESSLPGDFYSVLIQQIFSSIAAKHHHRMHMSEIEELCSFLDWVERDDINLILKKLTEQRYVRFEDGWNSYQMGPNLESLYNEMAIFSNILDGGAGIQVFHEGRRLATLPVNLNQVQIGSKMLFAGRYWEVISIGETRISVRSTLPSSNSIRPSYGRGFVNMMSSIVSKRIKDILQDTIDLSAFFLDEDSERHLRQLKDGQYFSETNDCIFMARNKSTFIYYTFAGTLENRLLQIIFSKTGYDCKLLKNSEGIAIHAESELDFNIIPNDKNALTDILSKEWAAFEPYISAGPFYKLLPAFLKRKEVLSQIDGESIIANLLKIRSFDIVKVPKILF